MLLPSSPSPAVGVGSQGGMHDARTFAARLVMKGVPLLEVSKLLGHSPLAMTMRYAHLAPAAFDAAIARLEAAE
jgi:site-specific recombinase XerD